jgi:hypothetical protein
MSAIAAVKLSGIINNALARLTTSASIATDATYDPEGKNPAGITSWVDRSGGIAIGFPRLTLQVRPPIKASRVHKVSARLTLPTLEQTSASTMTGIQPAPTLAYNCMGVMEFMLPERSTLAERTKLFSQMQSLLLQLINATDADPTVSTGSPIEAAVLNFEQPY